LSIDSFLWEANVTEHAILSVLAGFVAATLALSPIARADDEVEELRRELKELTERYEQQGQLIKRLEERLIELARRGRGSPGAPSGGILTAQAQQQPTTEPKSDDTQQPAAPGQATQRRAERSPVVEQIAQQELAPLFERRFSLEAGFGYSRFDRRLLGVSGFLALDAIFLGRINVSQVRSNNFTFELTGRYGLSDRWSTDLNVPFLYRDNQYIEGGAGGAASALSEATVNSGDIGDINAGLYYQFFRETANLPDIVGSLRLRAPTGRAPYGIKFIQPDPNNNNLTVPETLPTGTGMWTTQLNFSFLKTSDPLVLYGNIGYNYHFQQHFADTSSVPGVSQPGEVRLGNAFQWGAGFAIAFNERTSVNFSFSQLIGSASKIKPDGQNWEEVTGSNYNSATFQTGLTHQLSPRLFMISTLGIGLTPDAADFSIGLKFPYTF
jgi:hypothetical protein